MPAPTLEEVRNRIAEYLKENKESSYAESEITRALFYDENMGAQTASTRDIYKALRTLENDSIIIKKRQRDNKGERWVYTWAFFD